MVYGNKCPDADNSGTTNGTKVIIWDRNGGTQQKWTLPRRHRRSPRPVTSTGVARGASMLRPYLRGYCEEHDTRSEGPDK